MDFLGLLTIWMFALLASGLLASVALLLAVLRRAPAVADTLASLGVVGGVVTIGGALWLLLVELASPFLLLSLLPLLLALLAHLKLERAESPRT